jgi:hypothetical protein
VKGDNVNDASALPESTEHMQGVGASKADMQRGFLNVDTEQRDPMFTDAGSILGDSPDGFLSRPQGWER